MGITSFSIALLERVVKEFRPRSVVELGSQNLYTTSDPNPPFADVWYKANGFTDYACIDLAGDNNAIQENLSYRLFIDERVHNYDLVTDFGTSEHVVRMGGYDKSSFHDGYIHSIYPTDVIDVESGYYNCWLNKFNLCRLGGVIISENPHTGFWKDHGYNYISMDFYERLSLISDLGIIETGKEGATGNWETGVNVYSVLKKTGDKFPTFEEFSKLPIYKS